MNLVIFLAILTIGLILIGYGGRNWDYNGADYIIPITDTGIGFAVFCAAGKNSNQRILDSESNGGFPHRSIPIGVSVTWDCYVGYMDTVAFDVKCHTFL